LIESRQSYCEESRVQFFGPPCTVPWRLSGDLQMNDLGWPWLAVSR